MATEAQIQELHKYSACDISDALLKLKVPGAGFLPDILPHAPHPPHSPSLATAPKTIAQASTVLFIPKNLTSLSSIDPSIANLPPSNIPQDKHYVDLTRGGTVVVLSQPPAQHCAVLGGIMAARMKALGASGVVVSGRCRDLRELKENGLPVWARGTSTVGTAAEAQAWAVDVPIAVGGVTVRPGDIVFADPLEGVVVIPIEKLGKVLEMLPGIVGADEKVLEMVKEGGSVKEAFAKFR